MNGVHCPNLMTMTRKAFMNFRRQDFAIISSVIPHISYSKHLYSDSPSVEPVKLAYASYESMKGNVQAPKHPVVMMHGLFGSKNNWNSLSKAIHQQTNRKVIAVDARNHGDSPHSPEMSYKYMAADVVQLMYDLGFEKSVLIGHSMGGSAMMYAALTYPKLVEKLIVVDMSPVRVSPSLTEMGKIFKAMRSITLQGCTTLTRARQQADKQLANTVKPLSLRQFLMMNLVEAESGKFKWRVNLPVLEQNFSTQIAVFPDVGSKSYNGPTLFIGGGNSDYIKVEDQPKIKKLFPTATFEYIPGANHWVHADNPAEFLKLVTTFIDQSQS